jgi:hypothetical protein
MDQKLFFAPPMVGFYSSYGWIVIFYWILLYFWLDFAIALVGI